MTSYTKALYRRDPAAAEAFHRQSSFEHKATYGRVPTLLQFTPEAHGLRPVPGDNGRTERVNQYYNLRKKQPTFGKRVPSGVKACKVRCSHPACSHGCTLR